MSWLASREKSASRENRDRDHEKLYKFEESDLDILAEKVAQKVFEKKEEKEFREKEAELRKEYWEEGTDFLLCRPCSMYNADPEVPAELLRS